MMRLGSMMLALLVSLTVVGNLSAGEEKQQPEKQHAARRHADPVEAMFRGVTLTDEQKEKVNELTMEYGPKLLEAQQKVAGALTAEQRKARNEAAKAAKAAGKTLQETRKDIEEATNWTDEQKEIRKEFDSLRKEVQKKAMAILTPEQKAELKAVRKEQRQAPKTENQ